MKLVFILSTILSFSSWFDQALVIQTKHWELRTDLSLKDSGQAGELLDASYEVYRMYLSNLPQVRNENLQAWVFSNRTDYLETVQSQTRGDSGVAASTTGSFIDLGEGRQILAVDASRGWKQFENVSKHEAFHQFAYSRFRIPLPAWLNEGLAEYFASSAYINGAIIPGQPTESDIKILKNAIQQNSVMPFLDFMRLNNQEWGQLTKRGRFPYTQAWSMVQFLVHSDSGAHANEMDNYLRLLQNGMDDEEAFVKAFNTSDLEAFQQSWVSYVDQLKPGATIPAAQRLAFLANGIMEIQNRGNDMPTTIEELAKAIEEMKFKSQVRV
ncbi:DUF1570 domain-containing protein [PVC group bacterium]|nr:DUF1570 domain-containing protein [PVC group bacterium]